MNFEFPMTKEYAESIGKPELEGKAYKSNGGEMVWNEVLGKEIPVGWRLQLGEILAKKGYIRGPFGSSLKKDDMQLTGVPVYEQQHAIYNHRKFRYFISNDKHNNLKRFTVQPNDMVISCSGTLGKIIMIKEKDPIGIINQALLILRIDEYKIKPIIFKYFLTSPDGNQSLIENSSGSAQINIAKREIIESITMAISTDDIQALFESYLLIIDIKLDYLLTENNQLEIFKLILLSKMTKA